MPKRQEKKPENTKKRGGINITETTNMTITNNYGSANPGMPAALGDDDQTRGPSVQ